MRKGGNRQREGKHYEPGNVLAAISSYFRVSELKSVYEIKTVNSMAAFPDFSLSQCLLRRSPETVLTFCRLLHSMACHWSWRRARMLGKQGASSKEKEGEERIHLQCVAVRKGKEQESHCIYRLKKKKRNPSIRTYPIHPMVPSPQRKPLLTICFLSSSGGHLPLVLKTLIAIMFWCFNLRHYLFIYDVRNQDRAHSCFPSSLSDFYYFIIFDSG